MPLVAHIRRITRDARHVRGDHCDHRGPASRFGFLRHLSSLRSEHRLGRVEGGRYRAAGAGRLRPQPDHPAPKLSVGLQAADAPDYLAGYVDHVVIVGQDVPSSQAMRFRQGHLVPSPERVNLFEDVAGRRR